MPPKGGNAYIKLARQYIAAELNGLSHGYLPDYIADWMDEAKKLLDDYDTDMWDIPRARAIYLAGILCNFNEGLYPGWPHCDNPEDYNYNKANNIPLFLQKLFHRFPMFERILNLIL